MYLDTLEPRRLLAGVTILTHGQSGNITGWIDAAADAIQQRLGGSSAASQYVMKVDKAGVSSFTLESGNKPLEETTRGEAIVKLDWTAIDDGSVFTDKIAESVANYLLTSHSGVPDLKALPMHLIGHSRGASLMVALSWNLGRRGIWVDEVTNLDPHPIDVGDFPLVGHIGDAKMRTYDNVIFADTYYRKGDSNPLDPDGQSVDGTHNLNLKDSVGDKHEFSAHMSVTAYYHGTIDFDADENNDAIVHGSWYDDSATKPPRDEVGFAFSRLGGFTRPLDGVGTLWGGEADRSEGSQKDTQWANIINARVVGATHVGINQPITLKAIYNDRDSGATVKFFLDRDQNPLNNNTAFTFGSKSVAKSIDPSSVTLSTKANVSAGTYYLATSITDSQGHVRWAYGASALTLEKADFTSFANGVATIEGTSGADLFAISRDGSGSSSVLHVSRNGLMQTLATANIASISLDSGDGNDTVSAADGSPPMYVFGGAGNDSLAGSDAADTLSGGAGKNILFGGAGTDRLNGSGGPDQLYGEEGDDRLYGNGGDDILDGGGNIDRAWGGDGQDLLVGGGSNDKLYGENGNDTLKGGKGADYEDGGSGTDAAEDDGSDVLASIEDVL